jgi:peptide/nickel transport system substrate-binding protein
MDALPQPRLSRRDLLRGIAIASGVIAVPGLLAACSTDEKSGSGVTVTQSDGPIDLLTVALPASISTLDVSKSAGIANLTVALLVQEALVTVAADGTLAPGLAESWTRPDATTYVYKIRPDVRFSDGTLLTVDDVIASIEQHSVKGSTSAFAYAYTNVVSVTQTGDRELTITLSAPDSLFSWALSPGTLQITSRAFLAQNAGTIGTPATKILGTGPYAVAEFVPDSHVTLQRNDGWWSEAPKAAQVRIEFVGDETTRLIAMRQNSFDMATSVPFDQLEQWSGLDGVDVQTASDNSVVTLAFNTTKAPWNDKHVRAAVAHSIDRAAIVKSVLRTHGEVAATLPTRQQWGGVLDPGAVDELYQRIPQFDFDLDAAGKELAQSSVPNGFSDTVTYPNSGPQIGKALLSLAENVKKIGITLEVEEVSLEQWIADLGKHEAGISLGWYFATTGDPAEYTQQLLNADNAGVNGTNIADYRNDAVTDLLRRERLETDPAARGQLLSEALVLAAADVPYQPLWWGEGATAFGPVVGTSTYSPYFFIGPWATQVFARA